MGNIEEAAMKRVLFIGVIIFYAILVAGCNNVVAPFETKNGDELQLVFNATREGVSLASKTVRQDNS